MKPARSLAEQLLAQSRHLAEQDPRKPVQANLRRSVSAAYYALFHLLASESARRIGGSAAREKPLRQSLARVFQHRQMKEVCKWFTGGAGALPDYLKTLPQLKTVSAQLQLVAKAFVELQEKRHLADYSVATPFVRTDAIQLVSLAEAAFANWKNTRKSGAAEVFLLLLLLGDSMKPRG